ncbi:MAG: RNA pseudouridine synthase [Pirellula sp.]|nr:RNA pseudouridine synthase [Pirellula sp.]
MIEVLIDDPWFLVVNKPIDLLTQAVPGVPNLQSQLVEQLRSGTSKPFVGMPHRLDRMTSGVVVIARNQRALRRLCDQFAARSVRKQYLAWVMGDTEEQGSWQDWIRKIPDVAKAELVDEPKDSEATDARVAELEFQTLHRGKVAGHGPVSLVRVILKTGRMHQIRVQFAARGHPILGDALYGGGIQSNEQPWETREPMIALHASRLEFSHPKTAERVVAHAPEPAAYPWTLPER